MSKTDIEALRVQFADPATSNGNADGLDRVRASLARTRPRSPYSGVQTFLSMPNREDLRETLSFSELDVAIVGIPYDLGVTNRAGARLGPKAVRNVERVGPFHPVHRIAPSAKLNVADIGDVDFRERYNIVSCVEDIEALYTHLVRHSVTPLTVGGDHSISFPVLKAIGAKEPVGLIHIDAHTDTSGPGNGTAFHHATPFRNAVLAGVLDPSRTVQLGMRGSGGLWSEFSHASGMTVITTDAFLELGPVAVANQVRSIVGDAPAYVSFDIDSVDPGFAPGTGTPEAGGLAPREIFAFLRKLAGVNVVGGDVVELAPQYDPTTNSALVAAQTLFEILSLVALKKTPNR
ncbi:agmatinase [Agrobacterium sp. ICMP 6402]|uniref:agmatinase n=1 Tax=Agrobacterium sp. ICMP 6402 TaxID=2292443 RepID=UPI001296086E|nr:agmatinase [Agrobacterium sp. ICMP 6402]MQB12370.1 agmatinase [Agrobacterium sp. ICMP 6402]